MGATCLRSWFHLEFPFTAGGMVSVSVSVNFFFVVWYSLRIDSVVFKFRELNFGKNCEVCSCEPSILYTDRQLFGFVMLMMNFQMNNVDQATPAPKLKLPAVKAILASDCGGMNMESTDFKLGVNNKIIQLPKLMNPTGKVL
jgi:hypothetical protein